MTTWTAEAKERLRALWAEGVPAAEIGRRMGCTKNAVVGCAHRMKLPDRPSPIPKDGVPWTAEDEATMRSLRAAGWKARDIAAKLGREYRTVRNRLTQMGVRAVRQEGAQAVREAWRRQRAAAAQNSIGAAAADLPSGPEGGGVHPGGLAPAAHSIPAVVAGDRGPARLPGDARPFVPGRASRDLPSSTALPPARSHAPAVFSKACRFPLWGDRDRPDHRFCDAPTALGAYCAEHAARCYVPSFQRDPNHKVTRATFPWGGKAA